MKGEVIGGALCLKTGCAEKMPSQEDCEEKNQIYPGKNMEIIFHKGLNIITIEPRIIKMRILNLSPETGMMKKAHITHIM